jgi:hypothetical protein
VGPTPGAGEPRFPGFDVTDQAPTWDAVTRGVVVGRMQPATALRFFTAEETPTAAALMDRLLAQNEEPRVPVLALVDDRLARRAGDGYRFSDMPEDPEAWRMSIAALDADALSRHHRPFSALERGQQLRMVDSVRSADGPWHGLPATRVFSLWVRYACTAFYSHPWAWNEIGFGGPAYPRGYKNLGLDRREPWEVAEHHAEGVAWAGRAQAARRRHTDALGQGSP